tara:strand:- start:417 stop:1583 length:1167 start_codon:yes stop_codon:yes gene_type:complete
MEELFLINNEFKKEDLELIRNFLEFRKISSNIKSYDEIKDENINKSKIITNKLFEEKIGGREKLIKFGRNIGCSKILILEPNSDKYSIQSHLGESVLNISFKKINDFILELLINIISQQKFSFADSKTLTLIKLAKRVAETDVTVFVHGPTGTGKEVISNYIHQNSKRRDNPFIAVNCAAIPENMLEAMLFGHEKGAFTGASSANKGIFRAADTGTLLLDEISEMPLSLQAKLLRVLQEKKVTPIGGQRDIDVDVRVIATTNRNMMSEVKNKTFREDLYYRLNVFPIETTNLSERPGDIIPISLALLKRHVETSSKIPFISESAQKVLTNYSWPGNVRELENVLQRAIVLSKDNMITDLDIMIDNDIKTQIQNFNHSVEEANKTALGL